MNPLAADSITVVRAPLLTDEYGNPSTVRDWDHAALTVVTGVSVQPDVSNEDSGDRSTTVTGWKVFSDSGKDVDALPTDRVVYDGMTLEVDGEIGRWKFDGRLDHVEFRLKRVIG